MKLATWNVNSLKVRLPQVLQWLTDNPVDILCLQETKLTDDKFPVAEIEAAGYQVVFSGQKTYNGVAILSKLPITDVVKNNPRYEDAQQRILAATIGGVRVVCAYVPNGQSIESDKYEYKLGWLSALHDWLAEEALERFGKGRHAAALNMGDCFSYSVAAVAKAPLLFKGHDFGKTDLKLHPESSTA